MAEPGTFIGEVQRAAGKFWHLKWWIKWPIIVISALILLAIVVPDSEEDVPSATTDEERTATSTPRPGETPKPTNTPEATDTPRPTATPAPPTATPEPPGFSFGEGTKMVGDQVTAGATYRTVAGSSCYWERLSGLGGTLDEIEANDFGGGAQVVTIGPSDIAFNSNDCGTWTQNLTTPVTTSASGPIDVQGTLIVGVDIAPGTWRSEGGDTSCYWERLAGFSGDLGDIIANDFGNASPVVSIAPADAGFNSNDCGIWTKIG